MIGEILDGKYRIDRSLGAGGMGNVYLATHLGTTRVVAVKVIAPKWAANAHFLARFGREAQACGKLRHPNIVNVTDFGIAQGRGGHIPYLVMELLDGETLSSFQETHPQPALTLAADLLDQIGLALDEAHCHGIVHRDLKPENIWLEPNGRGGYTVKVLDFGVAKMKLPDGQSGADEETNTAMYVAALPLAGGESETIAMDAAPPAQEALTIAMDLDPSSGSLGSDEGHTMPGSLVGTPAYMSPEQALGLATDFRSDIYSMAVVAYSLVCGVLPFGGKTSELIEFHRSGQPQPPARIAKVPGDVSDVVLSGLAREPGDRPTSATEFARRFHNATDAEFFALRRSRAFLMRHLPQFFALMIPIYGTLEAITALIDKFARKLLPAAIGRGVVLPLVAAILLIFADNVMRAAAALIAVDEKQRVRRFVAFRVFWRLVKAMPALALTQASAAIAFGPSYLTGDCLWPVIVIVEKITGWAAVMRSRSLMTGLKSAGRALAIRHFALAALCIADLIESLRHIVQVGHVERTTNVNWFPIFVVFAAAPLYLYDRTMASKDGPLLQLDRTPEVRVTARPLSVSSIVWLVVGIIYLLFTPIRLLLLGGK